MGHFGAKPIRMAWLCVVLPALLPTTTARARCCSLRPEAGQVENPFFLPRPVLMRLPAGRARHGRDRHRLAGDHLRRLLDGPAGDAARLRPRVKILHTIGQRVRPDLRARSSTGRCWPGVVALVLAFRVLDQSGCRLRHRGDRYDADDTVLFVLSCCARMWDWPLSCGVLGAFFVVDFTFLSANMLKIPARRLVPAAGRRVVFTVLTTWAKGRMAHGGRENEGALPMELFSEHRRRRAPRASRALRCSHRLRRATRPTRCCTT